MKTLPPKKTGKQDRINKVLLGLVDYYIHFGRPVGSDTLKDAGFEDLSSATLRNYFASLEEEGFLTQVHASGGRIPTSRAFQFYAENCLDLEEYRTDPELFSKLKEFESKEVASFMLSSAELLSENTQCAVFLSTPRFDQDFITHIKLIPLEGQRCLCVLITDFGVVKTEMMTLPSKRSVLSIKRIESYFYWRITNIPPAEPLDEEEEGIAKNLYNEVMVRYFVGYSNFLDEEIYRTGFSKLLAYPEYQDAALLANSLSLFENSHSMRLLLRECCALNKLKFWIGNDLSSYSLSNPNCAVLAVPYCINQLPVGAVGILGPTRLPYRNLFHILRNFSATMSEILTRMVYKFKITYRQPTKDPYFIQQQNQNSLLLEHIAHPNRQGNKN